MNTLLFRDLEICGLGFHKQVFSPPYFSSVENLCKRRETNLLLKTKTISLREKLGFAVEYEFLDFFSMLKDFIAKNGTTYEKASLCGIIIKLCGLGRLDLIQEVLYSITEAVWRPDKFLIGNAATVEICEWIHMMKNQNSISTYTPLDLQQACYSGNIKVFNWIRKRIPDQEFEGYSDCFRIALCRGHIKIANIIKNLKSFKHDVFDQQSWGNLITGAFASRNSKWVEWAKSMKPRHITKTEENELLVIAGVAGAVVSGDMNYVKFIFSSVRDDRAYSNAIVYAINSGKTDMIKEIIKITPNPDYLDYSMFLLEACVVGNYNFAILFSEKLDSIGIGGSVEHCFRWACKSGNTELAMYIGNKYGETDVFAILEECISLEISDVVLMLVRKYCSLENAHEQFVHSINSGKFIVAHRLWMEYKFNLAKLILEYNGFFAVSIYAEQLQVRPELL